MGVKQINKQFQVIMISIISQNKAQYWGFTKKWKVKYKKTITYFVIPAALLTSSTAASQSVEKTRPSYCRTGNFRGSRILRNHENIMSANTILMMYLLRKHNKLSTFRSQSVKISCPRNGIFVNPRKYHVRENFLSYSILVSGVRLHF